MKSPRKQFAKSRVAVEIVIATLVIVSGNASAAGVGSTPQRSLLALSKKDHTLSIVDPSTLTVIARVPVGPDPHEVVASSDGKMAYVSNMGIGITRFHELDVIDLVAQKALPNVDTGPLIGLHGLAYAGGKVWFTAQDAKAVGRYDPVAAKVDWIMGTGQDRTHMIYVTADQNHFYTTNVNSGSVSVFDYAAQPPMKDSTGDGHPQDARPRSVWTQTVVPAVKGDEGFDVSPDGKELWTVSRDGRISIVDLSIKKVAATFDAKATGANRLKFTADGKRVLVSSLESGDLIFYDVQSRKEIKRLNLGRGAAGIVIDADDARAFVGCTADDYVAVVDLKTMAIAGHIDVGGMPDGLAWAIRPRTADEKPH